MSFQTALGVSWNDLKRNMPNRPEAKLHFVETDGAYFILLTDSLFELSCFIPKDSAPGDDQTDFEANFKASCNQALPTREVVTQFEKNDKRLKLAWASGTFGPDHKCVLSLTVPEGGRWIAGGWAVTDGFYFGDALKKAQVVDSEGLVAPAGTVLAVYHDQDVAEENQGWGFWPEPGGRGGCEIEPIGGYGFLPEGMLFEMHVEKMPESTATGVLINLWWAKNE